MKYKFRYWNPNTKEMIYSDSFHKLSTFFAEQERVPGSILMQSSELVDRKQITIYACDLLLVHNKHVNEVVSAPGGMGWFLNEKCFAPRFISLNTEWASFWQNTLIIGNSLENPDLKKEIKQQLLFKRKK